MEEGQGDGQGFAPGALHRHPGHRELQLDAPQREGARTKAAVNAPHSKRWRVGQNPSGWILSFLFR
jgi:hypothetical protein